MKNSSLTCSPVRGAISKVVALLGKSALIFAIAISVFACNNALDEPKKPDPTDTIPSDSLPGDSILKPKAPRIINFGVMGADTTISQGDKIIFTPTVEVNPLVPTHYKWVVQGDSVANTPTFEFEAKEIQSYNIIFYISNSAGTASHALTVIVKPMTIGFFVINEGWFGNEMGSVSYFNPHTANLITNLYGSANESKELGITTCYGSIWHNKMYLVSKQGRRLVVCDDLTFKELGSIDDLSGGDGRAFAGINTTTGVITTSQGAHIINLSPLSMGAILEGTQGDQCGGIYVTDNNILVLSASKGILIYNKSTYALVKQHPKGEVGFAQTIDGSIWAAHQNTLLQINPITLEISEITMPQDLTINNSWGSWNAGPLCAAINENALYFTKSGSSAGGSEIYRYKVADINSLNSAFAISSAADDAFYGSGIGVDPTSGDILATMVKEGWADSFKDNRIVLFDGKTGQEKSRKTFQGFYFPAMIVPCM